MAGLLFLAGEPLELLDPLEDLLVAAGEPEPVDLPVAVEPP